MVERVVAEDCTSVAVGPHAGRSGRGEGDEPAKCGRRLRRRAGPVWPVSADRALFCATRLPGVRLLRPGARPTASVAAEKELRDPAAGGSAEGCRGAAKGRGGVRAAGRPGGGVLAKELAPREKALTQEAAAEAEVEDRRMDLARMDELAKLAGSSFKAGATEAAKDGRPQRGIPRNTVGRRRKAQRRSSPTW